MENIAQFFYNTVPGSYFFIILYLLYPDRDNILTEFTKLKHFEAVVLLLFVIVSLSAGFAFQFISSIIKKYLLQPRVINKVVSDENLLFGKVENLLVKKKLFDSTDEKENSEHKLTERRKKIIFFVQNYLEANKKDKLLNHFGTRQAFWANIMVASIILIPFAFKFNVNCSTIILLSVIAAFSFWAFYDHLKAVYSIDLTTFASTSVFDNKIKLPNSQNHNFSKAPSAPSKRGRKRPQR